MGLVERHIHIRVRVYEPVGSRKPQEWKKCCRSLCVLRGSNFLTLVVRFLSNFCYTSTYTVFARLDRWVTERRSDTGGKRRKEKELGARGGQRCRNEEIIAAPTVATGKCRSRNERPEYTCSGYFRFEPIAQLSQLDKHARAPLRTAVIRRRRACTYK